MLVECNNVPEVVGEAIEDMTKRVMFHGVAEVFRSRVRLDVQTAMAMHPAGLLDAEIVKAEDPSVYRVSLSVPETFKARIIAQVARMYPVSSGR